MLRVARIKWIVTVMLIIVMNSLFAFSDIVGKYNPYSGMQISTGPFEFVNKPTVTKTGDRWLITFSTKSECDVTVAITDTKGKVIKHLASGVLGKNAPYPFKQNSLSQALEWDGKDDNGNPAPSESYVKVSLGLDASFDKIETWRLMSGIKPLTIGNILTVGGEGEIYAVTRGLTGGIHIFGKDGKYIRTIVPPSSTHFSDSKPVPEQFAFIAWNKTVYNGWVPRRHRFGGGFEFEITKYPDFWSGIKAGVVTRDGKLCLLYSRDKTVLLIIDAKTGACSPGGLIELGKFASDSIAVSPDGKWLYFGGRPYNQWAKNQPYSHAITRMLLERPGKPEIFIGEPTVAGTDNKHFNGPSQVACDANGNIYIGDTGNSRIQIYKPDGTYLKTIPDVQGRLFGVSHKTGAIYLWYQKSWSKSPVVMKLASLDNPVKVAELTIQGPWEGGQWREGMQSALLAEQVEPPFVLFSGEAYRGTPFLRMIEDKGDKLELGMDLLKANELPDSGFDVTSPGMWTSLHVNRIEETLHTDPVDKNGYLYKRAAFWEGQPKDMPNNKMWIVRYDPKTKKYISFEEGEPSCIPGSFLMGYSPLLQDGKPVLGIPMYYARGSHHHQGPFCIAPNGDIYVSGTYASQFDSELEKAALPRLQPHRLGAVSVPVLRVYDSKGKLKHPCILPGLAELEGLRVGRSGAVYVVQPWKLSGQKLPEGLAEGGSYEDSRWASLIKFAGNFEKFPVGRIEGSWEPSPSNPTHEADGMKVRIDGALWTYSGVSPHSAKYKSCTCMKASSDLDDYERSFVCAAQTCTINVIDSNGNVMARLGGYGNIDDLLAGKHLCFSLPRNVAVSDNWMWVVDLDYRALIKCKLTYKTEETVKITK